MSCILPRDLLALHVEGDLPQAEAIRVERHLGDCPECQQFFDELQASQVSLKTLRQETCSTAACSDMRRQVMSAIRVSEESPTWATRFERAVLHGLRRRGFAVASLASVTAMVSAFLLAQFQHVPLTQSAVVYEDGNHLLLPDGYRGWTALSQAADHRVYIDPAAYRAFVNDGFFPEGAIIVRESASSSVQVSVKDGSRFEGGWGFFDFSVGPGQQRSNSAAVASDLACRSCHEESAATDHVFTQSYPVFRHITGV